ncbi:uncharacterized protein [Panulirus ornatus]
MQESFGGLSAQRDLWFNNYSTLKRLVESDKLHLHELLVVSEMAIPLIWSLYRSQVKAQKNTLTRLVDDSSQAVPYQVTIPAPDQHLLHVEVIFSLHEEQDFQLEIFRDLEQIFHMKSNFEERRVVLGGTDHEGKAMERVVLDGENFPAIHTNQLFRVNVQVADDCIFASIWPRNLILESPMPLPIKHQWCTKDYRKAESFTLKVNSESKSSHSAETRESIEDTQDAQEDNRGIVVISAIIYKGLLYQ